MTLSVRNIKPERKYANFKEYCVKHNIKTNEFGEFTCHKCRGFGKIRDFKQCDPVEGYKFADWFVCDECDGKKFDKSFGNFYRREYLEADSDYGYKLELWKTRASIISWLQTQVNQGNTPFDEEDLNDFLNQR